MSKLLFLMPICVLFASCATTGEGRGVSTVEKMSPQKFETLVKAVRLIAKEGTEELVEREIADRSVLYDVALGLQKVANGTFSEVTTHIITQTLEEIPSLSQFEHKNKIMAFMEFIENRIERRGTEFVLLPDGRLALSERSRILLMAVSDGVIEATGD